VVPFFSFCIFNLLTIVQAARLLQGFPSANSDVADAMALRAAAEQSQLYNQALLDQINTARAASTLFPNQQRHDLFSTQGSTRQLRTPQDYLGLTGSAGHLAGLSPSNANASLYAAGLGNSVRGDNNSALTRQYLELLQNRQDAASALQRAEARAPGDAASLFRGRPNDRQD